MNYLEMMRLIDELKPGQSCVYFTGVLANGAGGQTMGEHAKFINWCDQMRLFRGISYVQSKSGMDFVYHAQRSTNWGKK